MGAISASIDLIFKEIYLRSKSRTKKLFNPGALASAMSSEGFLSLKYVNFVYCLHKMKVSFVGKDKFFWLRFEAKTKRMVMRLQHLNQFKFVMLYNEIYYKIWLKLCAECSILKNDEELMLMDSQAHPESQLALMSYKLTFTNYKSSFRFKKNQSGGSMMAVK